MNPLVRKQGAWSLWWLTGITIGIYYFVWYQRINRELCGIRGVPVPANGQWWSQLIPFYGIVALWATASRVNEANAEVGSPTRVSPFIAAVLAPIWFGSQTRYLQRRINILHDVTAAKTVSGWTPKHLAQT